MPQPNLEPIDAISPLDGRYAATTRPFAALFSEAALIRHRVHVEVEWLIELSDRPDIDGLPAAPDALRAELRSWVEHFSPADVRAIKDIEARINHDVKAVEYWIKERIDGTALEDHREFVHFACTSEDINNLAYGLALLAGRAVWVDWAGELVDRVADFARAARDRPMLAHTHGQPATPTTMGKELAVFVHRWRRKLGAVTGQELLGKMNGATGTFSAHVAAYPDADWLDISRRFVERLGLTWNPLTTQIEPHDAIAELLVSIAHFNTILIDFDRDIWSYISRGYLRQRVAPGEVGSSTMPHKVNPIRFENSESNAGISNALLGHLAATLPISRLQRDLTDSSALRNVGVAIAHSAVAIRSASDGFAAVDIGDEALDADLDEAWEVLGEGIQTVMRDRRIADPYEQLKELTRGQRLSAADVERFVNGLPIPDDDRKRLLAIRPADYTGLASKLVEFME